MLAESLNVLGQTPYIFPIHIYPEEYKFRWHQGSPGKRFPLSRILRETRLDFVIVVQGCLDITRDIEVPVLYYHRELERGYAIDNWDILAYKYPRMIEDQTIAEFEPKFVLKPACHSNRFKGKDLEQKDIFISDPSKEAPTANYKEIMARSQHVLIHNNQVKYFRKQGASVRTLEAIASDAIPILMVNGFEQDYRDMGFNESNCYFNTIPSRYDFNMLKNAKNLLEKHTIFNRAIIILEVIEKWLLNKRQ